MNEIIAHMDKLSYEMAIDYAIDLVHSEEKELNKHKTLLELSKNHLVDTIKSNIPNSYSNLLDNIEVALRMDTSDEDAQNIANSLVAVGLRKLANPDDLEIIEIQQEATKDYDIYAYVIIFKRKGIDIEYVIEVPNIDELTVKTIDKLTDYGKMSFGYVKNGDYRFVKYSYDIEDFKDCM
jgi:hypothetical protein